MRYVTCADERVSVIGVGTWRFTSGQRGRGAGSQAFEAGRIIQRALDLGVNLIDTAASYGDGCSERIVGRAIRSRRADAFIATKFMPIAPFPPIVARQGRASRRRLGIEAIDLFQIHRPNPRVPLRVQVADLRRLKASGVVRHIGVSNYSLESWQAAERALGAPIISNQVAYNLIAQGADQDLIRWAAAHDRIVIAHTPLSQGLLSAREDDARVPVDSRAKDPWCRSENHRIAISLIESLREIATAHGATPAQIALAWVVTPPNVVAIPGATSVSQVEENVGAADIVLTDEEYDTLRSAGAAFRQDAAPPSDSPRLIQRAEHLGSLIRTLW